MAKSKSNGGAAERLRKQGATLADFGLTAFRAQNLDVLLQEAAVLVARALNVKMVKILELLPEQNEMLVRAGVNWRPGVVGHATLGADSKSPGGYALSHGEPVISRDVATETRFEIPALLVEHGVKSMINVIIAGDHEPFGVLEVDASEHRDFDADDIAFLRNYANLLAAAIERFQSHEMLTDAAKERQELVQELQHRVKNILALVQAITAQTTTEDRTAEEFRDALLGRLWALSQAQDLMFEKGQVELASLVAQVIEPHRADRLDAVAIDGDPVSLTAKQGVTLGLVLYELATNAAKYGALSVPAGHVRVSWRIDNDRREQRIRLLWEERNGPAVAPSGRKGFGTRMIEKAFDYELKGQAELIYAPKGLRCKIRFPLNQHTDQAES
jgi:two-component sensor histidine kinase